MTNYEDEIDLRPYVSALLRRWQVLIILGALVALAALGLSLLLKRTYTSTATILVTRTSATLSLAEQFPTVKEPTDNTSRMNAFLSIARNDSIVVKVFDRVKSRLSAQEQNFDVFKKKVVVSNQGDAILITATGYSPQVATDIANDWANFTVSSINSAYSSTEPLANLQSERETALQDYDTAQAALEDFIKTNQIDLLNAQINESSALFNAYSGDRTWQIDYLNQYKQQMQALIIQTEALQKQVQGGTSSVSGNLGDALALLTARFNALNISKNQQTSPTGQSEIMLNFQITNTQTLADNAQNLQADVESLLTLATDEKAAADAKLESLRSPGPDQQTIEELAANMRALQTELENENARKQQLTDQRDLAWKAYQALLQKVTELQTVPETSSVVTMAEPAVPPQVGNPRGTLRNTLVGGVLGLMVGLAVVLIREWWQHTNLSSPDGDAPQGKK